MRNRIMDHFGRFGSVIGTILSVLSVIREAGPKKRVRNLTEMKKEFDGKEGRKELSNIKLHTCLTKIKGNKEITIKGILVDVGTQLIYEVNPQSPTGILFLSFPLLSPLSLQHLCECGHSNTPHYFRIINKVMSQRCLFARSFSLSCFLLLSSFLLFLDGSLVRESHQLLSLDRSLANLVHKRVKRKSDKSKGTKFRSIMEVSTCKSNF